MPKITIKERDLTSAGNLEVTTNAVYIPGYANMGPNNEPTLCESLEDFQMIFGSEPYKFRTTQKWDTATLKNKFSSVSLGDSMGNMYEEGEYEKSYIMAVELLKLGLPVLYERVVTPASATKWTASQTVKVVNAGSSGDNSIDCIIKATSSGLASSKIKFTINKGTVVFEKSPTAGIIRDGAYYVLKVWRESDPVYGISKIDPVETKVTFNPEVAVEYSDIVLIYGYKTYKDKSGLVELTCNGDVKAASGFNGDYYSSPELTEFSLSFVNDETPLNELLASDEFSVDAIYTMLDNSKFDDETGEYVGISRLLDKGEYIIKFITTGAYPVFEYDNNTVAKKVIEIAANRGDCTALIDHTPFNSRTPFAKAAASVFNSVTDFASTAYKNELGEDIFTYAAMFTPYGVYNCSTVGKQVMLPASFGYLAALAASVQLNGNWMAAAGVQRGSVPNLVALSQNITNAIADSYQNRNKISINPITNIKPYGLIIWGNRTLKNNAKAGDLTATSFLSIRQLTNDVKRSVYVAAKSLTFEQNNDILWINFKSKIIPILDQMVSGSGLSGYEIKKQKTTKKATIKAVVRLYAIEPVEDWDITIELADSSTEIVG